MVANRRFYFTFVLVAATLVGLGIVHGLWTDRWGALIASDQLAAHLDQVPMTVGAWEGKPIEGSQTALPLAERTSTLVCRYVNQQDGNTVSVLLNCGRPGPMVIKHLPTECYVS